jgi:NitT/TauT family transport system ATP-binding protein
MTVGVTRRLDRVMPLIEVDRVSKTFGTSAEPVPVLDDVSLVVRPGEIVALLGKSGSGKSTLLRCVAGLIEPSEGEVRYQGARLTGPNPGTAMVFQSFALLPWLTVRQNVELGLEARLVPPAERRVQAEGAIDLIGLDGFEDAYPKELSGGMRQRVGLARALVVSPAVLLMDEPFSALDVLTAENLRGELLELWGSEDFPIRAIVLVTHNIDEAVTLADRVLILGSKPGRIIAELPIEVPRPRDRHAVEFEAVVERIYAAMAGQEVASVGSPGIATPASAPLPLASVDALSGFAEILAASGQAHLGETASDLGLEVRDLLPLVDALVMLGFATLGRDGQVELSAEGSEFAGAPIQVSKEIFARAALERAPLVRLIASALEKAPTRTLRRGFFADILRRSFGESDIDQQLDIANDWGRYSEQFAYDADHDEFVADPDRSSLLAGGGAR